MLFLDQEKRNGHFQFGEAIQGVLRADVISYESKKTKIIDG